MGYVPSVNYGLNMSVSQYKDILELNKSAEKSPGLLDNVIFCLFISWGSWKEYIQLNAQRCDSRENCF